MANHSDHSFPIPFAAHQYLLRERLFSFLATLHSLLRIDVVHALEQKGKLFSPPETLSTRLPSGAWALLTFLVALYIDPSIDTIFVSNASIAVECFICALDLLDDVEDEDQTPIVQELGPARVLNVSTTLLMLAQRAILSLSERHVDPSRILLLLNTLQESALIATFGQHRDLLAEQRSVESFSEEECIEIAAGKAGSLMRLACLMGAICAGASDEMCTQFSEMGELLGIAHQLDNDSHDLYHMLEHTQANEHTSTVKTDIVRQKKTLPIVLAAQVNSAFQNKVALTDEEKSKKQLDSYHEGIITTWGICLLYRERAYERLQRIEAQGQPLSYELRLLLGFT